MFVFQYGAFVFQYGELVVEAEGLLRVEELFSVYMTSKVSTTKFDAIGQAITQVWEDENDDYSGISVQVVSQEKYVTSQRWVE